MTDVDHRHRRLARAFPKGSVVKASVPGSHAFTVIGYRDGRVCGSYQTAAGKRRRTAVDAALLKIVIAAPRVE